MAFIPTKVRHESNRGIGGTIQGIIDGLEDMSRGDLCDECLQQGIRCAVEQLRRVIEQL